MMSNERVKLTPEELDALMPEGEFVHTFIQPNNSPVLLGADWSRKQIIEAARKDGAELSGEQATAMLHGALVWDGKTPVFVATKPKRKELR